MKTLLCFGIILALHCLVQGVYSDDQTDRPGDSESKDIESEYPLMGRKIHRTAWSEEVSEDPEEFVPTADDSWNLGQLYSYLRSLIRQTEEMERMSPSETVAMIRDKIKSEIKARRERTTYRTDYSNEESDESCGEDGSSEDDRKENSSDEDECYGESGEKGSSKQETDGATNKTAEKGKQSTSERKSNQLPGQEITVLKGTNTKDAKNTSQKPPSITRTESKTKFMHTPSASRGTVRTTQDRPTTDQEIVSPTTSSDVPKPTVVINPLPTKSETSANQQTKTVDQDQLFFNVATESNAMAAFDVNTSQNKITNLGIVTTQKGVVADSKSASEILPHDSFEVIITAPEFIPIDNKEVANTGTSSSKISEVKPNVDDILPMPHLYGEKREMDEFNVNGSEGSGSRILQNQVKGDQSELDTTGKTSVGGSPAFAQNNNFQQESFFKDGSKNDILEEYNLTNKFIELSDNNKNEFRNILRDYKTEHQKSRDGSQHSLISQNSKDFNEGNTNQESFDTILEFLYKHSKNPLILSLKNSNETLF